MRLERYLKEKYMASVKSYDGNHYEVFKNPSKAELLDIIADSYGLRIILDAENKNIYIASGEVMHRHMMSSIDVRKDLKFDWGRYWATGEDADHIFMFDVDNRMDNINSDSLYNLLYLSNKADRKEDIERLLSFDFSWVRKYNLNPKNITGYIQQLYKRFSK